MSPESGESRSVDSAHERYLRISKESTSRVAHEFRNIPARRRDAPVTAAPMAAGDVNWCNVLAHHAGRAPDKVITLFEGEATTYREMDEPRARRRPADWPSVASARATSWRSCRTTVRNSSKPSSRPMPSAPSPCRSTGGSPRPRCATSSSTPGARALVCDDALLPLGQRGDGRPRATRSCGSASRRSTTPAWTFLGDLRGGIHRDGRGWRRPPTTCTG